MELSILELLTDCQVEDFYVKNIRYHFIYMKDSHENEGLFLWPKRKQKFSGDDSLYSFFMGLSSDIMYLFILRVYTAF